MTVKRSSSNRLKTPNPVSPWRAGANQERDHESGLSQVREPVQPLIWSLGHHPREVPPPVHRRGEADLGSLGVVVGPGTSRASPAGAEAAATVASTLATNPSRAAAAGWGSPPPLLCPRTRGR